MKKPGKLFKSVRKPVPKKASRPIGTKKGGKGYSRKASRVLELEAAWDHALRESAKRIGADYHGLFRKNDDFE